MRGCVFRMDLLKKDSNAGFQLTYRNSGNTIHF